MGPAGRRRLPDSARSPGLSRHDRRGIAWGSTLGTHSPSSQGEVERLARPSSRRRPPGTSPSNGWDSGRQTASSTSGMRGQHPFDRLGVHEPAATAKDPVEPATEVEPAARPRRSPGRCCGRSPRHRGPRSPRRGDVAEKHRRPAEHEPAGACCPGPDRAATRSGRYGTPTQRIVAAALLEREVGNPRTRLGHAVEKEPSGRGKGPGEAGRPDPQPSGSPPVVTTRTPGNGSPFQ